jgi:colanic acid biosynthesis glycosyl transferase WcaI
MPSKLTNILAVGGLSIVTANAETSLYELLDHYKMGILIEAENQHALNRGIITALQNRNTEINKNARLYAEENLSIHRVMKRFIAEIDTTNN